jgi:hypothetical protein
MGITNDIVINRQAQVAHSWWSGPWPDQAAQLLVAHGRFLEGKEHMEDSIRHMHNIYLEDKA